MNSIENFLPSKVQNREVSDTTSDATCTKADLQKIITANYKHQAKMKSEIRRQKTEYRR